MINREQNAYTWLVNGLLRVLLISNVLSTNVVVCMVPAAIDKVTQVVEQNKSLIPHYQIDQIPVESGLYFQRVVEGYNARVKRDVIAQIKQNVSKGNAHAKELLYLFDNLSINKTVKQATTLLMRAITAHRLMDKESAAVGNSVADYDRVYAAILLQCCVVLTNSSRDQFLGVLEDVNNSLMYWRDQKNHPTQYFFRKSPLKWVMGSSQAEEVAGNIKKLEKMERNVRIVLGQMIKHIYEFNPSSTVQECYTWIDSLFSILSLVDNSAHSVKDDKNFDVIADTLRFKLSRVGQIKNKILSHVASAKIPGHFVRNWMAYTLAVAATYKGYNVYMQNTDLVNDAILRSIESVGGVWQSVIDPVKRRWKIIFPGSEVIEDEKKKQMQEGFEKIKAIIPEFKKNKDLLAKVIEGGAGGTSFKEQGMVDLKKVLNDTYPGIGWSDDEKNNIISKAEKNDFSDLKSAALKVSAYGNLSLKVNIERITKELEFASVLDSLPLLQAIIGQVVDIGWETGLIVDYFLDAIDKWIKSNELTMEFVTLIPVFGIGLGVSKAYSWLTAHDYSSVRAALIEINALFIESLAPLSDHDYGKLVYLLQGLKKHAMRHLPTKNNVRSEFLVDIAKLESQQFTVKTKRKIIKNMLNKYPFLSLSTKSA